MKSGVAGLGGLTALALMASVAFGAPAVADDGKGCEVPAYLLTTDLTLTRTAAALRRAGGG
mgnify:CR=1 FL=1